MTEREKDQQEIGIGLVGCGFIGQVHLLGYVNLPFYYEPLPGRAVVKAVCSASAASCQRAMAKAGVPEYTLDYQELVKREDVAVIDCCTPNHLHFPVVAAALKAGKHVYCEKPLAMNLAEARELYHLAQRSGKRHQLAFHYRFVPATMRAKQLLDEGALGEIFHFRAQYLHSGYVDPKRPLSWRLQKATGGAGALFDLGSHVIDLMRFLVGDYAAVMADLKTFITERPDPDRPDQKGRVDVDDYSLLQVRMTSGALGVIEASRVATGANDDLRFEIHGSKGALRFSLMEPNWLWFYDGTRSQEPLGGTSGFTRIETVQRYPKPAGFPGPKFAVGWTRYHCASQYDFLQSIWDPAHQPLGATFADGVRVQAVLEAVQQASERQTWVEVESD